MNASKFLYFSFAYALFIIYGSLVPLDYRDIPFDQAWLAFQQIPYLNLGAASRADWIANILLYIPLTFSLAAAFSSKPKPLALRLIIATVILAFSISLAITIEFYQQFFPPRTVSQNDLIAETLGSITGLVLWFGYGKQLTKLYQHILQGGKDALLASAILYLLAYLTLSFFPYDFVTSFQELQNKLANGNDVFFISDSCGAFIACSSKLITEILLALPLGIFLSVLLRWHPRKIAAVVIIGLFIGVIIESIQLFLISGIAQGFSILTRTLGMWLGAKIYAHVSLLKKPLAFQVPHLRKYLLIATIPYVLLLANLSGWTIATQGFDANIAEKFNKLNWLPFYYHYYSTEAVALTSLLSIFAMYLPIGIGFWLWNTNKSYTLNSSPKLTASLYALCLCLIIEAGKLFFAGKHPDPTNLLISFAAVFISYSLLELMYQWFHQPETSLYKRHIDTDANNNNATEKPSLSNQKTKNPIAKSIASLILALLIWKITDYPNSAIALMAALILYAIILSKYPQAWLMVIPALLPITDLSPWTGRLFFAEFDYFIILTFAISLWYGRCKSPLAIIKPVALFLLAIYAFCYFISLLKGLFPLQAIDANAFANYYSSYNSLRVAKGLIWTILFLPLLAYTQQHEKQFKSYFSYGILAGLTAVVLSGIWERFVFTGLFDYSSDFRLTSTFYSMHTGGAPLDAYLLLSIPFISILLIEAKNIVLRTFVIPLLFSASLYTLLVTYSRGTYIAFVFACISLIAGLFFCYKKHILSHWQKTLWLPLFVVIIIAVARPILQGSFIQHRFSQAIQEVDTRSNHWLNSLHMMDDNVLTTLFGMGLGAFPRTYAWNSFADQVPASFLIQQEKNDRYLQLGSGAPVYIEQMIAISADTDYQLKLDYRMLTKHSRLTVSICEKAIQHAFECQVIPLIPQQNNTQWQHFTHTINTQSIGQTLRPVKLILHNSQTDAAIDIKNISLSTQDKNNLIKNGTFAKGMDHWFFTADNHIPWRTENLWVQILFDQGWLGLISFNLILLYAFIHLLRQLLNHDYYAAMTLTSLIGFLIVSIIDSTLNQPTISLLFFMIVYMAFINSNNSKNTEPLNPSRQAHILNTRNHRHEN
ncbi:MAG: VanZ family protein [Methyloprofundus sp.]|nr:VanZ family protein [Methyloprofundus sp.]